jgi:predicted PurR-regulated permease PerM
LSSCDFEKSEIELIVLNVLQQYQAQLQAQLQAQAQAQLQAQAQAQSQTETETDTVTNTIENSGNSLAVALGASVDFTIIAVAFLIFLLLQSGAITAATAAAYVDKLIDSRKTDSSSVSSLIDELKGLVK